MAFCTYSTFKSNGTGYEWIVDYSFASLNHINVKITHWAYPPEGPEN